MLKTYKDYYKKYYLQKKAKPCTSGKRHQWDGTKTCKKCGVNKFNKSK